MLQTIWMEKIRNGKEMKAWKSTKKQSDLVFLVYILSLEKMLDESVF